MMRPPQSGETFRGKDMATLIKFMNKDLNFDRLRDEIIVAGLPSEFGLLIAGFTRVNKRLYEPFLTAQVISTASDPAGGPDITDSADPGELRFRHDPALSGPDEATLDGLLTAHDASLLSKSQQNSDNDITAKEQFVQTYQDWGTLTDTQKDNRTKELFRAVARLIDKTTDI